MNAISHLALTLPTDIGLMSNISDSAAPEAAAAFNERMRAVIASAEHIRSGTQRGRVGLLATDLSNASEEEATSTIAALEEQEQRLSRDCRALAAYFRTMRRSLVKRGRGYRRLPLNRAASAIDLAILGRLELLRDMRLAVIAELARRPQEHDGPVLSTPEQVRAYFDSLANPNA